jgi:hypothetical protein
MTARLFIPERASELWRKYLLNNAHAKLTWSTHRSITAERKTYYPDLILEDINGPLLIVENKVSAPFRHANPTRTLSIRTREPAAFSRDQLNQLVVHGRWLAHQCRSTEWKGALATLTYLTVPPRDFEPGSRNCDVHLLAQCSWPQVWRWLSRHTDRSNSTGTTLQEPIWKVLARNWPNSSRTTK